jgi:choline kinase
MNVIILCAGMGSRLYPLTKDIPKCLVKVNGETLLERAIRIIKSADKNINICILAGYKHKQIQEVLVEKVKHNLTLQFNPFYNFTNSISSLWFALSNKMNITESTIVINGDIYFSEDIFNSVYNLGRIFPYQSFIVCDSSRKFKDADFKIAIKKGKIINMGKILCDKYFAEYAGIVKLFTKDLHTLFLQIDEMIKSGQYDVWYEMALLECIKQGKIDLKYLDIEGYKWGEIDTIEDLIKVNSK